MPNINIKIRNKVAKGEYAVIVCDNSDYTAVFDFDAEWDEYTTKTARFVYGGKYTDVVFSGNECAVPVMQDTRAVTVGVFAGDLHTTTPAYFACVPSILCGNGIPADPTPDVYAQIMELLGKISDESVAKAVTDALEQAKVSGEFDGEKGNDGVSPAVSVAAITGGNRVTITDAEGAKTFDVMDGAQGASGADGKDYVLTDTDKQEIAKTAAGLVDVPSVQPDWNQNDPTQQDYVKNRPFYTGDPVETVLVEESTVPFVDSGGIYIAQFPSTFAATVGETYKVYWDGAVYECTCVSFNDIPVIGNLSIMGAGSDTGEPFLIGAKNGIQVLTADTSASHTFSISGFVSEVVKIDPKYIRDMYYTGNPVETVLVEESTVSFAPANGGYTGRLELTLLLTVGETYKVSWDGTAYECTCVKFNNKPAIGNLSIVGAGSDTGEPFIIGIFKVGRIDIATQNTSASHTISISGLVSEVVKIDPKYLPDTIATKSEVEAAQTAADDAWTAADDAKTTASNAQTMASNAQTTASNAQTTANNAKSEALDLAARMFGHTSVVDNAFDNDKTLSITSLPACIESIGASAFSGCTKLALTSLPSGITSIGNGAFFNCTKLALTSLPSGLTSIGFQVFAGCTKLALTSLPSGLTSIDSYAFSGCKNLALTSLPSGITSIGKHAFYNCTNLTSITFTGTPTSIDSGAFSGCSNLTTINVPWAEGAVANAPWGATSATINYNYTEA